MEIYTANKATQPSLIHTRDQLFELTNTPLKAHFFAYNREWTPRYKHCANMKCQNENLRLKISTKNEDKIVLYCTR